MCAGTRSHWMSLARIAGAGGTRVKKALPGTSIGGKLDKAQGGSLQHKGNLSSPEIQNWLRPQTLDNFSFHHPMIMVAPL